MGNGPLVPSNLVNTELQSKVGARGGHTASKVVLSRTTTAAVLVAAAIAALAATSVIHSNQQAAAQSKIAMAPAQPVPAMPLSVPLDSGEVGPFSLGFLVFEHDPAHHLPGFAALPSGAPAR